MKKNINKFFKQSFFFLIVLEYFLNLVRFYLKKKIDLNFLSKRKGSWSDDFIGEKQTAEKRC